MLADSLDPVHIVAISNDAANQPGKLARGAVVSWMVRAGNRRFGHLLVPRRSSGEQMNLLRNWAVTDSFDTRRDADDMMAVWLENVRAAGKPVSYQTGVSTPELDGLAGSPTTRYRNDNTVLTTFGGLAPGDRYVTYRGVIGTVSRARERGGLVTVYGGDDDNPHVLIAGPGARKVFGRYDHVVGLVVDDPAA
jgi:hypothetical protein